MFGNFIIRFHWLLLAGIVLMTAGSVWLLPRLQINQDFSHYFPEGDEELQFYRQMTAELGDEDDLLAVALRRKEGIFDSVFLAKVHQFTLACDTLPLVKQAHSLTMLDEPVRTPFGFISKPFLHFDQPDFFSSDSLFILQEPRLAGRLVSKDLTTLVVNLQIEQNLSARQAGQLITGLEKLLQTAAFEESHLLGRKYYEVCYNRLSNQELKKGILLGLAMIAVFLGLMYRSVPGVALPMLVFLISMVNFLGYFVLIHRPLDAMSNLFPTIILISSLSDVIHLFSNYEDKLTTEPNAGKAMAAALNEVGLATFMTAFATAIGFLTFAISPIPAIRQFGLDVAFGVMLTYLITHTLVPAILIKLKKGAVATRSQVNDWWEGFADWLFLVASTRRKLVARLSWALLAISLLGIWHINSNNMLVNALPKSHEMRKSADFFAKNLAGVRTFEIAIQPTGDRHLLSDLGVLRQIEKLHNHLDSMAIVRGIYSPVTYYKSLNKSWHGGNPSAYRLPDSDEMISKQSKQVEKYARSQFRLIINEEKTWGKLSGRMTDLGRQEVAAMNRGIEKWMEQNMDSSVVKFKITGASLMIDKIQEYSIRNLFNGLLLDALAIGLLIALFLKQWQMVFITLATNIYPLFMAGALMGLTGIELRYGTSVIFIIGLVIAVDDTTHFLSKYMLARLHKMPQQEAIHHTLRETGKPILITFGILFFSFLMLVFSSFRDSKAIGILVGFLLLVGLLADLFLVPLLLMGMKRKD